MYLVYCREARGQHIINHRSTNHRSSVNTSSVNRSSIIGQQIMGCTLLAETTCVISSSREHVTSSRPLPGVSRISGLACCCDFLAAHFRSPGIFPGGMVPVSATVRHNNERKWKNNDTQQGWKKEGNVDNRTRGYAANVNYSNTRPQQRFFIRCVCVHAATITPHMFIPACSTHSFHAAVSASLVGLGTVTTLAALVRSGRSCRWLATDSATCAVQFNILHHGTSLSMHHIPFARCQCIARCPRRRRLRIRPGGWETRQRSHLP